MKLIDTITDLEVFGERVEIKPTETRDAVRAVLFDKNGMTPFLFVSNYDYHKLPGGGVEEGENLKQAPERECLEEIGCKVKITGEVGIIREFRAKYSLLQTSYCYIGEIVKHVQEPDFTDEEIEDGFQMKWLKMEEALEILKNEKPADYEGSFIRVRDLKLLEKARELMK